MSQYQEYAQKPTEFLALTGYTRQEFDALLPHFRASYYQWMSSHRLDGKPRGKRKYSDYHNCPLPLLADKLFFILNYLKTNNLQTVQGAFFGLNQPKANVWIHSPGCFLRPKPAQGERLDPLSASDLEPKLGRCGRTAGSQNGRCLLR